MPALLYQCENYLSPPLDSPLYIYKISDQSVVLNEGIFFYILRKASKWSKCVAEIIAFKDSD